MQLLVILLLVASSTQDFIYSRRSSSPKSQGNGARFNRLRRINSRSGGGIFDSDYLDIESPSESIRRAFTQNFVNDLNQGYGDEYGVGFAREYAGNLACRNGEVLNIDGSCARPVVSKNVFVYSAPRSRIIESPPPPIPDPEIEYNIVFVRTPKAPEDKEPIVIPPPQQKTLVYVLNERDQINQEVIQVPEGPKQAPEVFYVNYNEGENLSLPGGVSLKDAFETVSTQEGIPIDGFGRGNSFNDFNNNGARFGAVFKETSSYSDNQAYTASAPAPVSAPAPPPPSEYASSSSSAPTPSDSEAPASYSSPLSPSVIPATVISSPLTHSSQQSRGYF